MWQDKEMQGSVLNLTPHAICLLPDVKTKRESAVQNITSQRTCHKSLGLSTFELIHIEYRYIAPLKI